MGDEIRMRDGEANLFRDKPLPRGEIDMNRIAQGRVTLCVGCGHRARDDVGWPAVMAGDIALDAEAVGLEQCAFDGFTVLGSDDHDDLFELGFRAGRLGVGGERVYELPATRKPEQRGQNAECGEGAESRPVLARSGFESAQAEGNLRTSVDGEVSFESRDAENPKSQLGEHLGVGRGIGLLAGGDAVGFLLACEAMSGGDKPSERMEPEKGGGPSPGDGPEKIMRTHMSELVIEQGVELGRRQMCR